MSYVHAAVALNPPTGVARQMAYEADAAVALGLDWTVWLCRGSDLAPVLRRMPSFVRASLLRLSFYLRLIRLARSDHHIVLRHSPGDPFQFAASFFLKSYYTVHHTFEEEELAASGDRLARLQLMLERLLGRRVVARARGVVCVTPEIARHQRARLPVRVDRPVHVYPNGVLYGDDAKAESDLRGEQTEIVFLASHFYGWHGLESLLQSLGHSREDALLHLVGEVPESLLCQAAADSRVRIHGTLGAPAVDRLVARGWTGLSSFGLAHKGMTEACTLKTREYLRAGVPVYAGHRDSALPPDFAYFRQGPADWNSIVSYARAMRIVSRTAVAAAARPHIDKTILLEHLFRSLQQGSDSRLQPAGLPS